MKTFNFLMKNLSSTFNFIVSHVGSVNDLIVKSDEENLEKLLQKPEDKVIFQKAVDDLLKSENENKTIILNGKHVTISI